MLDPGMRQERVHASPPDFLVNSAPSIFSE